MFGCIITGSLCLIVSVLSCVVTCYVVADCQLCYETKELLLLLLLLVTTSVSSVGLVVTFDLLLL